MTNVCVIDNTEFAPAEERGAIWTGDDILYARPSAIKKLVACAKKAGLAIGDLKVQSRRPRHVPSTSDRAVACWLDLVSIDCTKVTVRDKDFLASKLGPRVAGAVWEILGQNRYADAKPRLAQPSTTIDEIDLMSDAVAASVA